MKYNVKVLFEGNNLIKYENIPYQLRDGRYIHFLPSYAGGGLDYFLPSGNSLVLSFSKIYEVNKLNLFFVPETSRFGYQNYPVNIEIWYYDENNNRQPLNWKVWNVEMGWKGGKLTGNLYRLEEGFLFLSENNFNVVRMKGLEIKTYVDLRITEIELTKVLVCEPTTIRINEVRNQEDEYKGYNISLSFVDKDFSIKNGVEYNNNVWILINNVENNKNKNLGLLYVNRIESDIVERITTINCGNIFDRMKNNFLDEDMVDYKSVDVEWLVENLCLQANIHSDLLDIKLDAVIDFIPTDKNIYEILVDVLKSAGDYGFGILDNRIYFRLRSEVKYEIVEIGEYGRGVEINPNDKKSRLGIPKIEFDKIWYRWSSKMFSIIGGGTNGIIREYSGKYWLDIADGGYVEFYVENLSSDINDFRFVLYIPKQGINNYQLIVFVNNYPFIYYLQTSNSYNIAVEVKYNNNNLNVKVYNDESNQLLNEFNNIVFNSYLSYINVKIQVGSGVLMNISGFATGRYVGGLEYDFSTPDAVNYYTLYALYSGDFEHIGSYTEVDGVVKDVVYNKIMSNVDDMIEVYFVGDSGKFRWSYPELNYNSIVLVEPVSLAYSKVVVDDIGQGIVEVYPKQLKYTKMGEFGNESVIFNDIDIVVKNKKINAGEDGNGYIIVRSEQERIVNSNNLILNFKNEKAVVLDSSILLPIGYKLKIDVEGYGTREYSGGINYDDILKWQVEFVLKSLKSYIVIMPLQNFNRKITKIEIIGCVWDDGEKDVYNFRDNLSIEKYGVNKKEVVLEYVGSYEQVSSIAKKYMRFNTSPNIFLSEQITTNLNLDVSFLLFVKIYDDIQKISGLYKVFEYEHYLDVINNNYETILRAKQLSLESYQGENKNYWGNHDYWGGIPKRYWGGSYYG